ncbi:DUF4169 family protein [Phaeobacter sp. B1627]|uniref:DUF4169 family protein n=1 Tax=Phaeobacter sp. B1627 TaxID=2583809 RepID=UPI00111899B6|nr:DUF4169 family protein [Phaeobacter sp. B1627]TNJ40188.1 DUF4169 family protein [Phaeobacter sp. B1627]
MSEIVNLNRFRKQKQRGAEKARADENAVKFGRSKAEKQRDKTVDEKMKTRHGDHKLED